MKVFLVIYCTLFISPCYRTTTEAEICDATDDMNGCSKKVMSYQGISQIHKFLDGDNNGQVDSSEADNFVRKEYSFTERVQKPRSLTDTDPLVSLSDLWMMWQSNRAFNWTLKDTVYWLSDFVELPQYEALFKLHSIDGKVIPLLAMQNMSYLTDVLRIRNPIHKKKLMLKALDVVLFGAPHKPSFMSVHSSLVTASFGFVTLVLFGLYHYTCGFPANTNKSDVSTGTEQTLKQLQKRLADLEELRSILNTSESLVGSDICSSKHGDNASPSNVLQKLGSFTSKTEPFARTPNPIHFDAGNPYSNEPEACSGLFYTPESSSDLRQLNHNDKSFNVNKKETSAGLPPANQYCSYVNELVLWLQLTYELELTQFNRKKADAELHLNMVRQTCKRLNRKKYNILGSLRVLQSDNLQDLERRLIVAKFALEQLQTENHERITRWNRIEALTGYQLRKNSGLNHIRNALTHSTQLDTLPLSAYPPTNLSLTDLAGSQLDSLGPTSTLDCDSISSSFDRNCQTLLEFAHADGKITQSSSHLTLNSANKTTLPRSYSFVRPFAMMWRRKAENRFGISKKFA